MATTPVYGLRYPVASMPADVPADMGNLANDTDAALNTEASGLKTRVGNLETQFAGFQAAMPGDVKMSAAAGPLTGWLLCDGSAVSRTTYSALFAAIGAAYGAGDGSTSFNLPDLRGRMPVGVGPNADTNALGKNEGALPANRRARHKHTVNDPGHSHLLYSQLANGTSPRYQVQSDGAGGLGTPPAQPPTAIAATGVSVGPQTGAEPVDSAAYLTLNFFIKT